MALKALPLPAAFDEAVKSIRSIIREKRKQKRNYEQDLYILYKLACVRSFMLDYAPILKQPGYNVMLCIPGKLLFNLEMNYKILGINKLELLTKTDKEMMQKEWGDPNDHITMNELYSEMWNRVEKKLAENEEKRL
jgi:hypothetical protein